MSEIEAAWNSAEHFVDKYNNPFSALYAKYELRNYLSDYVRYKLKPGIKYLVIVALERGEFGQKSYRQIDPGFDVGAIAEEFGGNGHPEAASVPLTEEQKKYADEHKSDNPRKVLEYLVNSSYNK